MTETELRMRETLVKTGLYSGEDRFFSAEMAAYGAGLEYLYNAVEKAGKNLFVQTADEEMLGRFERLFRIIPSKEDAETRRQMLLARGSVTPADHTKAALERQLLAAGIRGNIAERGSKGIYVNVHAVLGISKEAAMQEAMTFMPAHLPCELDFGVNTWDAVDGRGMTFADMELYGRTWDSIDRM